MARSHCATWYRFGSTSCRITGRSVRWSPPGIINMNIVIFNQQVINIDQYRSISAEFGTAQARPKNLFTSKSIMEEVSFLASIKDFLQLLASGLHPPSPLRKLLEPALWGGDPAAAVVDVFGAIKSGLWLHNPTSLVLGTSAKPKPKLFVRLKTQSS